MVTSTNEHLSKILLLLLLDSYFSSYFLPAIYCFETFNCFNLNIFKLRQDYLIPIVASLDVGKEGILNELFSS